jgi:hypothetical protein
VRQISHGFPPSFKNGNGNRILQVLSVVAFELTVSPLSLQTASRLSVSGAFFPLRSWETQLHENRLSQSNFPALKMVKTILQYLYLGKTLARREKFVFLLMNQQQERAPTNIKETISQINGNRYQM